jgi:hypothetical protein
MISMAPSRTPSPTVSFAIDGVSYEIDLNEDNAGRLRDAFADVIASGRRVGGRVK